MGAWKGNAGTVVVAGYLLLLPHRSGVTSTKTNATPGFIYWLENATLGEPS